MGILDVFLVFIGYLVLGAVFVSLFSIFGSIIMGNQEDLEDAGEDMTLMVVMFWPLALVLLIAFGTIYGTLWAMRKLLQPISERMARPQE